MPKREERRVDNVSAKLTPDERVKLAESVEATKSTTSDYIRAAIAEKQARERGDKQ